MPQLNPLNITETEEQNDSIVQRFSIPVEYRIYFTQNTFSPENPILDQAVSGKSTKKVLTLCFVDRGVLLNHPQLPAKIYYYCEQSHGINLIASPLPVEGGETCKNDPLVLQDIYKTLMNYALDRHSCILVIGGGALLDLVGYAAATAHRGIRLLRMPSTVLSQNDSGVGVKNGINFLDRKNYLGTFSPPDAVICDFSLLHTLSARDKRAGMAEAIKVGLIRDPDFFKWHEDNRTSLAEFNLDAVSYSIKRSALIHSRQISTGGDPFEKGSSRPLDYGHWLAHKLEALSGYEVKHGEAVAIGMLVDARYACATGLLSEPSLLRIKSLLEALGFQLWHPALQQENEHGELLILEGLEEFREHLGGDLSVTLLTGIGSAVEVSEIQSETMRSSLEWVKKIGLG